MDAVTLPLTIVLGIALAGAIALWFAWRYPQ